ncbi:MAG: ABC transporter permease [Clostridiaceae bacterium]|jgi:tungstate transport system permease protein|nr:ABC transporter permease [Clostridiaceae bacterium]
MGENDPLLNEIIATTMKMAFTSSALALLIGVPFGILIGISKFPGKKIVITVLHACMALPSVVVGLTLYILFSGTGAIYSVRLMVVAQVVLIAPVTAGMAESYVTALSPWLTETAKGLRLKKPKVLFLAVNESKYQFIVIYLMAFARSISEVGAVQIVGGNILHETRVMTTAIALNYNMGQFRYAVALGIILLLIALGVNTVATIIQHKLK